MCRHRIFIRKPYVIMDLDVSQDASKKQFGKHLQVAEEKAISYYLLDSFLGINLILTSFPKWGLVAVVRQILKCLDKGAASWGPRALSSWAGNKPDPQDLLL